MWSLGRERRAFSLVFDPVGWTVIGLQHGFGSAVVEDVESRKILSYDSNQDVVVSLHKIEALEGFYEVPSFDQPKFLPNVP